MCNATLQQQSNQLDGRWNDRQNCLNPTPAVRSIDPQNGSPTLPRKDFSVGIDEEYFLVDAKTFDCVEAMPEAFWREAQVRTR